MVKNKYTCSCCSELFTRKNLYLAHEKKCSNMQGVEGIVKTKTPKRKAIPSAVRFSLWNATFGERQGAGMCFCCGREVTQQNFEAGHILSVAHGGSDKLSNLRVICRNCNGSMGTVHMDEFMARFHLK